MSALFICVSIDVNINLVFARCWYLSVNTLYFLYMYMQQTVHPSFHCSQPFSSLFRCSWWFGRTQNKGYNSATGHFVSLLWSPGTVYHCTFVRHLHCQPSKTCSIHICSLVPTSLTVFRVRCY